MSSLPARPRLAAHVLSRRHIVDGDERIVLHDLGAGRLVQIGPREWGLLAAADGTRDLAGIVLAAAREGAHAREAALRGFLEQLHAAGMLEDGAPEEGSPTAVPEQESAAPSVAESDAHAVESTHDDVAARPLLPLPGYTLTCDGSGSCCRFYGSVIFGPVEAARARALLPLVRDGGARHERVFMPEHGSAPTGGSAVTFCDGHCVYLGDDGRCGLHAAGGPGGKPLGCRVYPATFIDDGESVRVSVSVECACVLTSVDRPGGAPLVPEGARTRGDLDESLVVESLDEQLPITASSFAPRATFVAWSREIVKFVPAADTAASLFALARAVESKGLDLAAAAQAMASPAALRPEDVGDWAAALSRRAARRAREDASWRNERDLVLRAARWITAAAEAMADTETAAAVLALPPPSPRSEQFYLEALLHGHRLASRRPLVLALRDRAVRIVVARALVHVVAGLPAEERDPAAAHPLALVEATLRGHGLDMYVEDVEM
ncbi:MAG: YkgJ family cysteine cluster protein [Minicystis sp.]